MATNFRPRQRSAVDEVSGVAILLPRMMPATRPDGSDATEFEYTLVKNGERVGAMGFFGTEETTARNGRPEWSCILDLSHGSVLESMLDVQRTLGHEGDPFFYLCDLAQGLIDVILVGDSSTEDLRYEAFTQVDALAKLGVAIPGDRTPLPDGRVVLAETLLPARSV